MQIHALKPLCNSTTVKRVCTTRCACVALGRPVSRDAPTLRTVRVSSRLSARARQLAPGRTTSSQQRSRRTDENAEAWRVQSCTRNNMHTVTVLCTDRWNAERMSSRVSRATLLSSPVAPPIGPPNPNLQTQFLRPPCTIIAQYMRSKSLSLVATTIHLGRW